MAVHISSFDGAYLVISLTNKVYIGNKNEICTIKSATMTILGNVLAKFQLQLIYFVSHTSI